MLKIVAEEPKEPHKPYDVDPPKEIIETHNSIYLDQYKTYTIQDIQTIVSERGVSLDDVRFRWKSSDNGCDVNVYLSIYYIKRAKNPQYNSQLKEYKKKLKQYMKDMDKYSSELEEYKVNLKEYFDWRRSKNIPDTFYHGNLKKKYDIK